MNHSRGAVAVVVLVVGVCALVSGPLVAGVDLTPAPTAKASLADATGGTATVETATLESDGYELSAGRYGSGVYTVDAPPATVTFSDVRGSALVTYRLTIPELGYSTSALSPLDSSTRTTTLTLSDATVAPESVTESSYDATVELVVRSNGTEHVVSQANVTVVVQR